MVNDLPEVIDLTDAIRNYLPKSLEIPPDVTLDSFKWHLHDKLPSDRQYPYGTIEILNSSTRGPPRKQTRYATKVLITAIDTPTYSTGADTQLLVQQDVESITSVVGTLASIPLHSFIQDVDYQLDDDDRNLSWLMGGDKPDNGTAYTITYRHRKYRRQYGADGTTC